MPFWSSRSRVERIIASVPAYAGFEVDEIGLPAFLESWLPELERDDLLVGVNWSGPRAVGYDMTPGELRRNLEAASEASS